MPLLVGALVTTPPPPPAPPRPPVVRPTPINPGEYVPTFIDPDGVEWAMNPPGQEFFTLNAVTGYGITPVELITRPDPRGGVVVAGVRDLPRTLVWPVRIRDRTHLGFLARWRAIGDALAKTKRKGPGLFRLTRPDGSAREVLCHYQGGMEGEPGGGWLDDTPELSLLVPDGHWRAPEPIKIPWSSGDVDDYFAPYPMISSGDVLGDAVTVTNPGQVEAWPTWRLEGPATQLVATNNTRGQAFTIAHDLGPGEYLDITTRPGRVTDQDGEPVMGALVRPGSVLWRLDPGANDLDFAVTGGGPATRLTLSFYPRWETA
ncbi:phage distal tail protein [Micromonospora sp. NPDC049366]|uniref:phage distal tail protein n=1 Tax=Micromonospora sp. NPDC049366 TaxID=3364271 RepID=UPI0037A1D76F